LFLQLSRERCRADFGGISPAANLEAWRAAAGGVSELAIDFAALLQTQHVFPVVENHLFSVPLDLKTYLIMQELGSDSLIRFDFLAPISSVDGTVWIVAIMVIIRGGPGRNRLGDLEGPVNLSEVSK
jgi:hypothetical protein